MKKSVIQNKSGTISFSDFIKSGFAGKLNFYDNLLHILSQGTARTP
jgi:hypothetical protein